MKDISKIRDVNEISRANINRNLNGIVESVRNIEGSSERGTNIFFPFFLFIIFCHYKSKKDIEWVAEGWNLGAEGDGGTYVV